MALVLRFKARLLIGAELVYSLLIGVYGHESAMHLYHREILLIELVRRTMVKVADYCVACVFVGEVSSPSAEEVSPGLPDPFFTSFSF